MSDHLKAKEGIILDQDGTVIPGTQPENRSGISWNKASGLIPKLILGGVIAAALFFGFGILSILLVVMVASLIIRTVFGFFGLTTPRLRSRFIFTVKR